MVKAKAREQAGFTDSRAQLGVQLNRAAVLGGASNLVGKGRVTAHGPQLPHFRSFHIYLIVQLLKSGRIEHVM